MDGVGSVCVVIPGPGIGGLGNAGFSEHVGIVSNAVRVQAVGDTQLMALSILGGLQVGIADAGNIHNTGSDVVIQRIDLVHVHGEVAAQLENVPHLVRSNQGLELGEIVIKGVILVLDLYVRVQGFIQLDGLDGAVMAVLRTPPCHAQVNFFIAGGSSVCSRGCSAFGSGGSSAFSGGGRGGAAAAGCQAYAHSGGHCGCNNFLFHMVFSLMSSSGTAAGQAMDQLCR